MHKVTFYGSLRKHVCSFYFGNSLRNFLGNILQQYKVFSLDLPTSTVCNLLLEHGLFPLSIRDSFFCAYIGQLLISFPSPLKLKDIYVLGQVPGSQTRAPLYGRPSSRLHFLQASGSNLTCPLDAALLLIAIHYHQPFTVRGGCFEA